ncbi:MAG: ABC transporter permease [Lachnospiraceae bacterium]|nr:ABC transporter permease [Lachnospiraceae bacterium]
MNSRLIINSIRADKPVALATTFFMAASAMLLCLSVFLFAGLYGSIDRLMRTAGTPDFLQMHTGALSEKDITDFSERRDDVEKMQIVRFLNLQNSEIMIGDASLSGNTQDNGLCCQSRDFDFLIDPDNRVIHPKKGEVYVPVCYREEYGLETGDVMCIGAKQLNVAGFLRDSQMNSMMASSKRFLVNEEDYERLKVLGSEEYLIEFKLRQGSDLNAFSTAYREALLPGNGPTITRPLISMMNALSDGMMILVILLVSVVVLFISILCIRTLILTQLEKDKGEIGILKAVGVSKKGIRSMYFSKYLLLSIIGCVAGVMMAMIPAGLLSAQMRELYGDPGNMVMIYIITVFSALAAEGIILSSVLRTLHRTEKLSAIEALYGQGSFGKQRNLLIPMGIITAAAVFIILVPWNMKSTIQAPEFASYMGIGDSQLRIDIRQTADMEGSINEVAQALEQDDRVRDHALMKTGSYKVFLPDGPVYDLMIEDGDHGKYPVKYTEGSYPKKADEIALSILNAKEMDLKTGDILRVRREDENGGAGICECRICGIYSDITNGGKTAKACFNDPYNSTPVMWSVIYLSLKEGCSPEEWVREYKERYSVNDPRNVSGSGAESTQEREERHSNEPVRVTLISDYLAGTYGQTIRRIKNASAVSLILSCLILFVVIMLLTRLAVWKERGDSSLKKALGFTSSDLKKEYLKKMIMSVLAGLISGIFAGIIPGERLAGMLLGAMGAYGFHFIISPVFIFAAVPAMTLATVLAAMFLSLKEVEGIRAFECLCMGAPDSEEGMSDISGAKTPFNRGEINS